MNLFFNSSMPRSGSELFQVLLHQNPEIYASPTSPLLEYQFGARQNYELSEVKSQDPNLMQEAFVEICSGMTQSYYGVITDRPNVIDKNRGWSHYFEWAEQWNPNPKMVCLVRDLRSIIASFERIYRANRHRPIGPGNPAEIQGMTLPQRVNHWLSTQPVGLALRRTEDLFHRNIADKILFIRFEDLCRNPQSELNCWYDFTGIERFEHQFKDIKKEVYEDDSHYGPYGVHHVASEIKPAKGWTDVIPSEIAHGIHQAEKWYQQKFNYA